MILKWCKDNQLKINSNKTIQISFSRKTDNVLWNYFCQKDPIKQEKIVKDLGIHLDQRLNYHVQIDSIIFSCRKIVGCIKLVCQYSRDYKSALLLFKSLVRSKIEYLTSILTLPPTQTNRLEQIQINFIKYLHLKFKLNFPPP